MFLLDFQHFPIRVSSVAKKINHAAPKKTKKPKRWQSGQFAWRLENLTLPDGKYSKVQRSHSAISDIPINSWAFETSPGHSKNNSSFPTQLSPY
jgi:hypothetical protein